MTKRHSYKLWSREDGAGIELTIESEDVPDATLFSSLVDKVRGKFPGLNPEPSEEAVLADKDPNDMTQREFTLWRQMQKPKRLQVEPESRGRQPFADQLEGLSGKAYASAGRNEEEMRQREQQLGKGIFSATPRRRTMHR